MFAIKNNLGPLTAIIMIVLAVPFITSLFYGVAFFDSLDQLDKINPMPLREKLGYAFLGAAYVVGGMATILVGVPYLIDRIFSSRTIDE